ncbi:hypothetical protein BS50DRAFT_285245 [Corynespora cassiicola Philippines]|uniref:CFEM domain-containing protein n=1 Tax=Corynespora cassiicola Philippines TaxID=1448308 RepID=A0A2T2P1J6_CORCC|nr:hypothetical protein BS50DRAFT_285245 [Corynespora cassiicola Philippines]
MAPFDTLPSCAEDCWNQGRNQCNAAADQTKCICEEVPVLTALVRCSAKFCSTGDWIQYTHRLCGSDNIAPVVSLLASYSPAATVVVHQIGSSSFTSSSAGPTTTTFAPTQDVSHPSATAALTSSSWTQSMPGAATATGTPQSTPSAKSPRLSVNAVAGLSVGMTLLSVLLVFGAYVFWRRKKQMLTVLRKRTSDLSDNEKSPSTCEPDKVAGPCYEVAERPFSPKELEERHGMEVARKREGRLELPE